jgi:hypothetical protein
LHWTNHNVLLIVFYITLITLSEASLAYAQANESAISQSSQGSRSYVSVIGPSYARIFVNTNISSPVTQNASELNGWPDTANYNEQMQWRDADTGKLLAASDFSPPATFEGPVPVGYGGMIYDVLNTSNIIASGIAIAG